ncbi:MAG: inorganic phosphate transporter [Caulobacteraceae bacterium]|jgi:PiT family inorganic phosphate transporter
MTATAVAAPALNNRPHIGGAIAFALALAAGLAFTAWQVTSDISGAGEAMAFGVFALLGVALLIALGFEFVNGFHDTANAVATVIYTHSLPPLVAVVWSGVWNFIGVLTSSGGVAFAIVTLLPVELILQVGSSAGYDMIFALLIAAIIWNLGTWAFGIPNSSSHALIGSIMGVGLANQMMAPVGQATSGVDWGQATTVFQALLFSPLVAFTSAAVLLLILKFLIKDPRLFTSPEGDAPPPPWIRGLLILTCTSVSFGHGSNDGQKGMGLIMLILIGAAPTAYALNRTMNAHDMPAFVQALEKGQTTFAAHAVGAPPVTDIVAARKTVGDALRTKKLDDPAVYAALSAVSVDIESQVKSFGSIRQVPAAATPNMRNEMYLAGDATRILLKSKAKFSDADKASLKGLQSKLEAGTRFIPTWVKIAVAFALGLGTMVGWKRIVVTVGEKIGKTHLTYAQGASAEIVAAITILAADNYHLPLSTTHVLSSGIAGTMMANGSGLQWSTVRSIALAWVTTLPAAIFLAGSLYWILRHIFP